MPKFGTV